MFQHQQETFSQFPKLPFQKNECFLTLSLKLFIYDFNSSFEILFRNSIFNVLRSTPSVFHHLLSCTGFPSFSHSTVMVLSPFGETCASKYAVSPSSLNASLNSEMKAGACPTSTSSG